MSTARTRSKPHFTFRVPIALDDLHPSIQQGQIACAVMRPPGNGPEVIGTGSASFDIRGGRFHKTVTVEVTALPGADPAAASHYRCDLSLAADTTQGRIALHAGGQDWATVARGIFSPAPGAPFSPSVEGELDGPRRAVPAAAAKSGETAGKSGIGRAFGAFRW